MTQLKRNSNNYSSLPSQHKDTQTNIAKNGTSDKTDRRDNSSNQMILLFHLKVS